MQKLLNVFPWNFVEGCGTWAKEEPNTFFALIQTKGRVQVQVLGLFFCCCCFFTDIPIIHGFWWKQRHICIFRELIYMSVCTIRSSIIEINGTAGPGRVPYYFCIIFLTLTLVSFWRLQLSQSIQEHIQYEGVVVLPWTVYCGSATPLSPSDFFGWWKTSFCFNDIKSLKL